MPGRNKNRMERGIEYPKGDCAVVTNRIASARDLTLKAIVTRSLDDDPKLTSLQNSQKSCRIPNQFLIIIGD